MAIMYRTAPATQVHATVQEKNKSSSSYLIVLLSREQGRRGACREGEDWGHALTLRFKWPAGADGRKETISTCYELTCDRGGCSAMARRVLAESHACRKSSD
eukprot:1180989-Prorocentrum_minimum.AAC.1